MLPFRADPGEKRLARVFLLERIVHERYGPAGTADAPAKLHDSAKVDRAGNAAVLPFV